MADEEVTEVNGDPVKKSFGWYIWWKIDRTVALLSLFFMVYFSLTAELTAESSKIVGQAIGVLAVYIGARSAK